MVMQVILSAVDQKKNVILMLYLQTPTESEYEPAPNSIIKQCGQLHITVL
jgi:hypothetical protein